MKNARLTSVTFAADQKLKTDDRPWRYVVAFLGLLILMLNVSAISEDKRVEESVKKIENVEPCAAPLPRELDIEKSEGGR